MDITIRQINGTLSALQLAHKYPDVQTRLKELISLMLLNHKNHISIPPEDSFYKAITELSSLQVIQSNYQKRFSS